MRFPSLFLTLALLSAILCACPVDPPADAGEPEDADASSPQDAGDVDGGPVILDAGETGDSGPPLLDAGDDAGALADAGDAGALADAGDDGGSFVDAGSDAGVGVDGGPSTPTPGDLDVEWIAGAPNCSQSDQDAIQVHAYSPRTWILRQSKCTNFEGPFLYLLVGDDRALLLDSGATQNANIFPLRSTIESILETHLSTWPNAPTRENFELIVAHTHGHGDHTAGDAQFNNAPNTTVVRTNQSSVRNFFELDNWPDGVAEFDLGGRVVDILPLPGHQSAHIALYDRLTGLLLTGDSLYPGRLYIQNFSQYRTSIDNLTVFAAERPVVWVLGTHIEMTSTPGQDFAFGATYQPNEHPLELTFAHLVELRDALFAMGNNGSREVHDSFIISP